MTMTDDDRYLRDLRFVRDYYNQSIPPELHGGGGVPLPAKALPADVAHFTISVIQTWVDAHPDMADEVLAAEQSRGDSARVTLVDWLQGFISHRDEGTLPEPEEDTP